MQDLNLMHVMCAKLCHDIAAPLGAIRMGMEMLDTSSLDQETLDIVNGSIRASIHRLELYRALTGYASAPEKPSIDDVRKAVENYWYDKKVLFHLDDSLDHLYGWPARQVLALCIVAGDSLIRGGEVFAEQSNKISARGAQVQLYPEVLQALAGEAKPENLSSKNIIAHFSALIADNHNCQVDLTLRPDELCMTVVAKENTMRNVI